MKARLFRTIDVVAALTNVSLDNLCSSMADELVCYVTGYLIVPEKGSKSRQKAVDSIRSQLPSSIRNFGISDLVEIIMQINHGQHEDLLKTGVIQILEDQHGHQMTLSPEEALEAPSTGLQLLRSLAERPDVAITRE